MDSAGFSTASSSFSEEQEEEEELVFGLSQIPRSAVDVVLVCGMFDDASTFFQVLDVMRSADRDQRTISILVPPSRVEAFEVRLRGLDVRSESRVYVIAGSPLNHMDLLRAGLKQAVAVVVLNQMESGGAAGKGHVGEVVDPSLVDADSILSLLTIEATLQLDDAELTTLGISHQQQVVRAMKAQARLRSGSVSGSAGSPRRGRSARILITDADESSGTGGDERRAAFVASRNSSASASSAVLTQTSLLDLDVPHGHEAGMPASQVSHESVLVVTELVHETNLKFLSPIMFEAKYREDMFTLPAFAAGRVFTSSMIDTAFSQTYYNAGILQILQLLIGSGNESNPGLSQLHQIPVPESFHGSSYVDLVLELAASSGIITMGLYRYRMELGKPHGYVFTNPPPVTPLLPDDLVFVLSRHHPTSTSY